MKVNILGTEYTIIVKKYDEEEAFERQSFAGYCDGYSKQIIICDMHTYKGWEYEPEQSIQAAQKETMRHEIVHAFFNESGLKENTFSYDGAWARNEEMIDWLAMQIPKIYKVYEEVGCL